MCKSKSNKTLQCLITFLLILLVSPQIIYSNNSFKSGQSSQLNNNTSNLQVTRSIASMSLAFTENQGQWDEKVKFRANAGGATMWFVSDGAYYQFTRRIEKEEYSIVDKRYGMPDDMMDRQPDSVEMMMIKASFVGANPNPQMVGVDMMEYKCNYFIGNDPNKWHTDVPNYSAVLYEQVYDGIDLKYYGNGKQMEYDLIVSPGSDFSQIKIQYEGAESISVNDKGELVVNTMWGEVIEQKPIIYQTVNNSRIPVTGKYSLKGDNSFGFELSNYDKSKPLVIDPVLVYSTYLGGSDYESGIGIAVDDFGNAYTTGSVHSTDFPTVGEYQTDQLGNDVYVTKLNSSGNTLVYSTYLGGSDNEGGSGIAVDASGVAYITGGTSSTDFPTFNPYQSTIQGGGDVFVTKLSSSGNALVYSTYLGGSDGDSGVDIKIDESGNAFITGGTNSINFPIEGEFQTHQGDTDVFVTKLNQIGNGLVYSTYIGGSIRDVARAICLDNLGNAYITGYTTSADFPTQGEYQVYNGSWDAFIVKLNSIGNTLIYSTYLGTNDFDAGEDIVVDNSGNAFVTGWTESPTFPTVGAFQDRSSNREAFVTKLNSAGDGLIYSTYLGGIYYDEGHGIEIDQSGNAYITGFTDSPNFPTTDEYINYQGGSEAFVTKLNSSGNALVYSTFFGGTNNDMGWDIAIDEISNIYISGRSNSPDFPIEGSIQNTYKGGWDVFIVKIYNSDTDSDDDWIPDDIDNCLDVQNFNQEDSDNDGAGNACDECPYDADDDIDNDGICGDVDNCPDIPNSDQTNSDTDQLGDACDECIYDSYNDRDNDGICGDIDECPNDADDDIDNDGFCGDVDNCPDIPNPDQMNSDFDGLGDACDDCIYDGYNDRDNDGICGDIDNCAVVHNPEQEDNDNDGIGNECDECPNDSDNDIDNDHICGDADNCPDIFNHDQEDYNDDGVGNACDCCVGTRGNVNADINDVFDIDDLIYMVEFSFKKGSDVVCLEEGDVDASGVIDVDDLVFMVNFAFKGGPAPGDCP